MRIAPVVFTAPADIDRLQSLIPALRSGERVEVTLDDGRVFDGIVADEPVSMQFFDTHGREGTNAILRLEQPALPRADGARRVDLFLHQVVDVRPLDRHELESPPAAGAGDAVHLRTSR